MQKLTGASHPVMPILPSLLSIAIIGLTLVGALVWQSEFASALSYISSAVDGLLRWWYVALVAFLTAFVFGWDSAAIKNVLFGKNDEQPDNRFSPG